MASRKNKWRKRGRLEFRRETKRYHDGTPWGHDVLYVRIKRVACAVIEPWDGPSSNPKAQAVSVLVGTYRLTTAIEAAHLARSYLFHKEA
jgi:hypothetical protein